MRPAVTIPVLLGTAVLFVLPPILVLLAMIIMMMGLAMIFLGRRRRALDPRSIVRGFARDVIRMMENNPRTTPSNIRDSRARQLDAAIELGNRTRIPYPRGVSSSLIAPPFPDPAGFAPLPGMDPRALLGVNEDFASDFWKGTQGIRNGCMILLHLLEDHNPVGARNALKQHLSEKRPQSFSAMRELLCVDSGGIGWFRERELRGLSAKDILSGLDYRPFDEEKVYRDLEILEGFRGYVR